MVDFADRPVRVTVPATSANLGPGFDSLGLALDLRDELVGEVVASGLAIEVEGEGAGVVPLDETHLVVRAMRAVFEVLDAAPPGLRLTCRNRVPHARGLGSSSAAIVGGLVLARALVGHGAERLHDDDLLAMAADLEGHPDNVAPALLGGLVISGLDEETGRWFAAPAPVHPDLRTVVFVPPDPVATEVARGLLPAEVSHRAAAANSGRAALLVAALAGRPDDLYLATRDFLHQEQRRPAMPRSLSLVDGLRADRVPAVISGAGPSVLALVTSGAAELRDRCPDGWAVHELAVSASGAVVG